eukprot:CAMPEP_0169303278 /NCGR_PEP_ID=MMETSP1016-20121227/69261_1 /TAXON_ID=342587 /ORGANISM="Karlodinium micrum, Strain CCMP2283" /LENGTH=31 /DNA_ID= /DNA_START= /DNA_END= /DNA_ORIENTATION=
MVEQGTVVVATLADVDGLSLLGTPSSVSAQS